jgi:hypothetical protein
MNVGNVNINFDPFLINFTIIRNNPSLDHLLSAAFSMRSSQFSEKMHGYLELNDKTRTALTSDRLPLAPPPLTAFDAYDPHAPIQTHVGFSVVVPSGIWLIHAELVQLQQVPEPSAWLYFGVAMIALGSFRLRRSII